MKTLTKKHTHTATVRRLDLSIMEEVCLLLNITDETYFKYQYKVYEQFCEIACMTIQLQNVRHSKIFRGFWINEWAQRNPAFISMAYRMVMSSGISLGHSTIWEAFEYWHSAEMLTNDHEFMIRFGAVVKIIQRKEFKSC